MDWLLHYTLHNAELRARSRVTDQKKVLRSIVSALQPYKEFYAIIANCLRKTDYSICSTLLEVLGSPIDLFNECISRNKIEEAAYLLRIIQTPTDDTLQGLETACTGARRLFPTVVARHNFTLAFELLRFIALLTCEMDLTAQDGPTPSVTPMSALERVLRNMLGRENNPSTVLNKSGDFSKGKTDPQRTLTRRDSANVLRESQGLRLAITASNSTIVHALLIKDKALCSTLEMHAVQMLASGRLAQLCTLFEIFSLDMSHFLTTRWKDVASTMDLREAFDSLHKEFVLPRGAYECTAPTVPAHLQSVEPNTPTRQSLQNELNFFTPTQVRMMVVTPIYAAFARLKRVFAAHYCTEYVLLLSTILLCVRDIQELLREHPELTPSYVGMLSDPCNAGYSRLVYECGLTRTSPVSGSLNVRTTSKNGLKA
jgi:hypothetical protein